MAFRVTYSLVPVAAFCTWLAVSTIAWAQPGKDSDELSWDRNIRGLYGKYCLGCHNESKTRGDVNLALAENPRQIREQFELWQNALTALTDEAMPPDDADQPSAEERDLMIRFLEATLQELDCEMINDPGRPVTRRLNRTEYDFSIEDLTGLDLQLADAFPPDPSGYGFDNIGDVLTLNPVQVEQYDSAAREVVRVVLSGAPESTEQSPESVAAFRRIFAPALNDQGEWNLEDPNSAARNILQQFAQRAFRRPVDEAYVDRLVEVFARAQQQEKSFAESVGYGMRAVLISPRFLLRVEQLDVEAEGAYLVDSYDMASRLSFFLWSRPPDETLLALAAEGRLNDESVLREQTLRMLEDPRSDALVESFFGQWLELRNVVTHQPDPNRFPEFTPELRAAMLAEANAVLGVMVRENRSITTILDSDFTFVNQSLAELYGLPGEYSSELVRVNLPDRRRGGLVTSAALLMIQSDPQRVNVPRRGNFIAGRILGSPPPPPPPNVPPLEEAAGDTSSLTLRERFELHRNKPDCMGCHAKIDPLGFALQNYDAIGRWADTEVEKPIDASGTLPDGRMFDGPVAFKDLLLEEQDAFAKTLSENLLIYALGRGLEAADRCVIDDMLARHEESGGVFSELVIEIVLSLPFRYRVNPMD